MSISQAVYEAQIQRIADLQARLADKEILLAEAIEYGTGYKQAYDEAMANYQVALARLTEAEALLRIAQKSCDRETAACIDAFLAPDSAPDSAPDAQEGI